MRIAVPLAVASILGSILFVWSDGRAVPVETASVQTVGVMTMVPSIRPYLRELPGRIAPTRIAEVRARVPGVVMVRAFEQGSEVSAGDVLYKLDPAPYEVELSATSAALDKSMALFE
ncbi:MAG TPA: biotin/lipoyl-binding protein, partial [Reyranella sp.]|nr:biotin/lipoyl-binding protein [Reyranella sp.]